MQRSQRQRRRHGVFTGGTEPGLAMTGGWEVNLGSHRLSLNALITTMHFNTQHTGTYVWDKSPSPAFDAHVQMVRRF